MDGISGTIIILLGLSAILVPGIILMRQGRANKTKMIIGSILVGLVVTAATFFSVFLGVLMFGSSLLGLFLAATPFIIISGLIFTLAFGLSCLVKGYSKDENGNRPYKKSIIVGWVMIGINIAIVATFVILFVLFATGLIPIALM